jgi:NAD(P)-dependent dehydrogenase (short-subunit alcohol dehydrogenase family)
VARTDGRAHALVLVDDEHRRAGTALSDARGRVALVTGATDGIGRATALALAARGVRVLVHGRDAGKAAAVADEIRRASGDAALAAPPLLADLASMADVRRLAGAVTAAVPRLDVLLHNAGVYQARRAETADGFETTFAVNHLAPFLLTAELLPLLEASAPSRVVVVASGTHRGASLDLRDLQMARAWDAYDAYARSKLANVLFARALARRLDPARVTANALHPGVIATKLLRAGFGGGGRSPEQGARTSVYVATEPALAGVTGRYFDDAREAPVGPSARDDRLGEALWRASAELVAPWASDAVRARLQAPARA